MSEKWSSLERAKNEFNRKGFGIGHAEPGFFLAEHPAEGYPQRTAENAKCDATCAIAADYSTGGERLTARAAGTKYLPLPLYLDAEEAGRRLGEFMKKSGAKTLNVAGNGIYTLIEKGFSQTQANHFAFECLKTAHGIWPISHVQSGGQTGFDWAGIVAARALGIDCCALLPKGYRQRNEHGVDKACDPATLASAANADAALLLADLNAKKPARGGPCS